MSTPIERLILQQAEEALHLTKDPQDAEFAEKIRVYRTSREGEVTIPTETDPELELEWHRQVNRFIELGFHKELGMNEQEYQDSLPRFGVQPEAFKGRLDTPLLVETRVPVSTQANLAKVKYFLIAPHNPRDWEEDPQGYQTPKTPYTTWVYYGTRYRNISVKTVRDQLDTDERGGTEYDGIALSIMQPELRPNPSFHLPGTSVSRNRAVFLTYPLLENPRIDDCHHDIDVADWRFTALICARANTVAA